MKETETESSFIKTQSEEYTNYYQHTNHSTGRLLTPVYPLTHSSTDWDLKVTGKGLKTMYLHVAISA